MENVEKRKDTCKQEQLLMNQLKHKNKTFQLSMSVKKQSIDLLNYL